MPSGKKQCFLRFRTGQVVDTGIHAKGWSREKAIEYMLDNEPVTEQFATAEVERYMAMPGQALAYKVGSLKLQELRNKHKKQLGSAFHLSAFHNEVLMEPCHWRF